MSASSGGLAGFGLEDIYGGLAINATGTFCIQFEMTATICANMVETALRLTRVDNISAATLRAADHFL